MSSAMSRDEGILYLTEMVRIAARRLTETYGEEENRLINPHTGEMVDEETVRISVFDTALTAMLALGVSHEEVESAVESLAANATPWARQN